LQVLVTGHTCGSSSPSTAGWWWSPWSTSTRRTRRWRTWPSTNSGSPCCAWTSPGWRCAVRPSPK